MKSLPKLVVFTDLDGTLLDHDTYQWDAARPALRRLAALNVPVILASSKTQAEITLLQRDMLLSEYPAIVENGSGVIGLGDQANAPTYPALRHILDRIPKDLRRDYRGFGDMTATEIAAITGLTAENAQRAKSRDFSEPGVWTGNDVARQRFQDALSEHGVIAQQGGRFLTLSFGQTKADAMETVITKMNPDMTFALGDASNDIDMLEKADHGVIIANPHRPSLPRLSREDAGRILRTKDAGPSGWNQAVNNLLDQFGFNTGTSDNG